MFRIIKSFAFFALISKADCFVGTDAKNFVKKKKGDSFLHSYFISITNMKGFCKNHKHYQVLNLSKKKFYTDFF